VQGSDSRSDANNTERSCWKGKLMAMTGVRRIMSPGKRRRVVQGRMVAMTMIDHVVGEQFVLRATATS
jgi:hypothetical protein